MGGYDTISLWLPAERAGSTYPLNIIPSYLSRAESKSDQYGQTSVSGYIGQTLKVKVTDQGVSLRGSLSKYFWNDGLHDLTRGDTQKAIQKISDELHLPVNLAKVNSLHYAVNLITKYCPTAYFPQLGESKYLKRSIFGSSLYYTNDTRQMILYDKVQELRKTRSKLPKAMEGANIFRIEYRGKNRLRDQFNRPEITASLLYQEDFYIDVVDKLMMEYNRIDKLRTINFNLDNMTSPKDFWKQAQADWIKRTGGEYKALELVEQLRNQNAFQKKEYYSRLKKEIKHLCREPHTTDKSELIEELDRKMEMVVRSYR